MVEQQGQRRGIFNLHYLATDNLAANRNTSLYYSAFIMYQHYFILQKNIKNTLFIIRFPLFPTQKNNATYIYVIWTDLLLLQNV